MHADAGDLAGASAGPDAGVARLPLARDVEPGERVDQGLLERAQVPMQVAAVAAQVQDGIADELPRAVEGDIAAALDLEDRQVVRLEHVARARGAAQRPARRVLEQQEHVPLEPPRDARLGERPLPLERLAVRHQAGLDHVDAAVTHSASLKASSRLPRTAHALAALPSPKQASPHTARPATPSRWSIGQAMKPSSSAPTHARTAITPRCHRLSSRRLRRQPNVAPTAMPASVPARTGSAALS